MAHGSSQLSKARDTPTTYSFNWPAGQDTCHIHISGGAELHARHTGRPRALRRADASASVPLLALPSPDVQRSRVAAERPAIGERCPVSRCVAPCECKSLALALTLALTLRRPPRPGTLCLLAQRLGAKAARCEAKQAYPAGTLPWSGPSESPL